MERFTFPGGPNGKCKYNVRTGFYSWRILYSSKFPLRSLKIF